RGRRRHPSPRRETGQSVLLSQTPANVLAKATQVSRVATASQFFGPTARASLGERRRPRDRRVARTVRRATVARGARCRKRDRPISSGRSRARLLDGTEVALWVRHGARELSFRCAARCRLDNAPLGGSFGLLACRGVVATHRIPTRRAVTA